MLTTKSRLPFIMTLLVASLALQSTLGAFAKMPTCTIGKNIINLEVAQTPKEIEHGLMGRTALDPNAGMVFLFSPARGVRFWMYNCFISMDMIFVKDGKIIRICKDVPPCKDHDPSKCPTYPEGEDVVVSEVIEVNAGYCVKNGVKEGDTVKFEFK